MQTEFLIIGQGISGTFLSWYLNKAEKDFIIIDRNDALAPSRVSGGIINPVTGRRMAKVWLAEEIIPFAASAYHDIGSHLGITAISQKNIIDFFPNAHQRVVFMERMEKGDPYLHSYPEQNDLNRFFNYELGCGEIRHCYTAHLDTLLPAWRKVLLNNRQLIEDSFDLSKLIVTEKNISYKDITADKIIFCDGPVSAENPYFKPLPFAPNKGDALVLEIPGLPDQHIYKKGFLLAPLATKDMFWLGSSYLWDFTNLEPEKEFYLQAERHLKAWLKVPFTIVEHKATLRPATLERRPFVGWHPLYRNIGILNGMGTKGCSLAPYFANQFVQQITSNGTIDPVADVNRFRRILTLNKPG